MQPPARPPAVASTSSAPALEEVGDGDAPPKQVALAMERLSCAAGLIADIRLRADRLLEALFLSADVPHHSEKTIQLIHKEETSMSKHFQDLRDLGRQLEDSGVLSSSFKSRGNSWGLHMPLVCPDGAVVAYAWKRQLAGQAGAAAVDRTSYVHARGLSGCHVFRHITRWICSYHSLFTKACSKCRRLLMMEKSLSLLLPPVHRPYLQKANCSVPNQSVSSAKGPSPDLTPAFHIGCSSDETV